MSSLSRAEPVRGRLARPDLITFGSVFLEVVFGQLDRLPRPGEEIYVSSFALSVGGGAVTAAVTARRTGAAVGMAAVLGDDLGSRLTEWYAAREGVDVSPSERAEGPAAGVSVVLNFDRDRAFISHMPGREPAENRQNARWAGVLHEWRPAWCWLHPGPGVPELLREAHRLGTRVALDIDSEGIRLYPELVAECAKQADIFFPTEDELLLLTGTAELSLAIERAGSWSPRMVVKRGAAGAVAVEDGVAKEVRDGLKDVVVMDRTGAGDAFAGAVIATLVRGGELVEAVVAGNAAGSEAVARLGSVGDLREFRELAL